MRPNLQAIENRLIVIFNEARNLLPENQLADMSELARAGEPGIALENFCTQLVEYEVEISSSYLKEIKEVGRVMGIHAPYWERLIINKRTSGHGRE